MITSISDNIIENINNQTPYIAGKLGSIEATCLAVHFSSPGQKVDWDMPGHGKTLRRALFENTGVFPTDDRTIQMWIREYLFSLTRLNAIVQWCEEYGDKYIIENFCKNSTIYKRPWVTMDKCFFGSMKTFQLEKEKNWFKNLQNKKVLVVSPFYDTITKQVEVLDEIWQCKLNFASIDVIKFPYSPAVSGEYTAESYFEILKKYREELSNREYDIALIGAGSYSVPLLSAVQDSGKVGIHLGGALQLMFGIRGGRFDADPHYGDHQLYKSNLFTRPLDGDTPKNPSIVERGCYW